MDDYTNSKEKCFICSELVHFVYNSENDINSAVCPICNSTKLKSDMTNNILFELTGFKDMSLKEAKELLGKREFDIKNKALELKIMVEDLKRKQEKVNGLSLELKNMRHTKGWVLLERLRKIKRINKNYKKLSDSVSEIGFKDTLIKILSKLTNRNSDRIAYKLWIKTFEPSEDEIRKQASECENFAYKPLISILVPTFETDRTMLIEMIESVLGQTYGNWELCIADGCSRAAHVKEILDNYSLKDTRIKVKFLDENKGIIGNSNAALEMCSGEYISLLDHDDTLAPFALYEIVKVINRDNADFIYSDEDKINRRGDVRYLPHFKPDWSPDTLRSYNYITHLVTIGSKLINEIGGFRTGFEGSQDHDLILRATSAANKVSHIPKILYHWRAHENSVAGSGEAKLYAFEAGKKAVQQNLVDSGINGFVQDGLFMGTYHPTYAINENSKVAIIIPNKDKIDVLQNCIESIIKLSTYKNYEIIIVENSSNEDRTFEYYKSLEEKDFIKIVEYNQKFNYSAVNNFGVGFTDADYYIFLNNDVEVISKDWIEAMMEHAQRKEVGVVGAKLLFKNKTIQHAGVVVGMRGWADHVCSGLNKIDVDTKFYCKYLVDTIRNTSAVTGACMMISKEKFNLVGGFNEEFILCGSDVEICLNMLKRDLVNIYTPYAKLYHYESLTRKNIAIPEIDFKLSYKAYHKYLLGYDPYYNPNLDYRKSTPTLLTERIRLIDLNSYAKGEENEG